VLISNWCVRILVLQSVIKVELSMMSTHTQPLRIIIVGGAAGGASAAAKARRVDEHADIKLFEAGKHISYAVSNMPYTLGGTSTSSSTSVDTSAVVSHWKKRFNVDVFLSHWVDRIDRINKCIYVKTLDGLECVHAYDSLVLSTGAGAIGE
jgi:NADPH-dependent 2,4-dienoyl-CoA reductase/sulfur reductase-like enzyme